MFESDGFRLGKKLDKYDAGKVYMRLTLLKFVRICDATVKAKILDGTNAM